MKKQKIHILRLTLIVCFIMCLAVVCFHNNFILEFCSKIFVRADSYSNSEIIKKKEIFTKLGAGTNELVITSITAENREYDGSKLVNLQVNVSGIIPGDDVKVTAKGNTINANADEKKFVVVDTGSIEISGENAADYYLSNTEHDDVYVDIYKKQVELIWETSVNPMDYVYTGNNQLNTIKAYFYDGNVRYNLPFSVNGFSNFNNKNFYNDFTNAGDYTAKIISTAETINYEIKDNNIADGKDSIQLKISRADPVVSICEENSYFIYNGLEQDASKCFEINNTEQTLKFLGNKFTTVTQGNNLEVTVTANESANYYAYSNKFIKPITVSKANSVIDISGVNKNYTYNGSKQTINSGATINNNEQTIYYDKNEFITVEEGNSLEVLVYAIDTENYNYTSKTFKINVAKQRINTFNWEWGISSLQYNGASQEIKVRNIDRSLVTDYYTDNVKTNVGVYCAKVSFVLNDPANYEMVTFPDKIWKITKKSISKPNLDNYTTTYTGEVQTYEFKSNDCVCYNNTQTNAGNYQVLVTLKDTLNCEWLDGGVDAVVVNWTIEKQVVKIPEYIDKIVYDGHQKQPVIENSLYTLLENKQTDTGNYVSYVVLNDSNNYKWETTNKDYIEITWHIVNNENYKSSAPILAIIFAILIIVLLAIYLTLHFTIVVKKRRKRKKAVVTNNNSVLVEKTTTNNKTEIVNKSVSKIVQEEF